MRGGSCPFDQPPCWRTTHYRLSATAYSIHLQLSVSSSHNLRTRHAVMTGTHIAYITQNIGYLGGNRTGIFNLLSSRANLHLSYNPAGRSHCRLQNHHGYIKQHHRGMGGSFYSPSIASPTSQLIRQPFCRFTYVTAFSNPSIASPTSQALHVLHLASRPCIEG